MLALTIAPVAGSYLLYYFWPPEHTVNYGELIEARRLPDEALATVDGAEFRASAWRGKWVLLMVDSAACDAYCEKKLYYMRQVRLAQGKEMGRVERAFLITDQAPPAPEKLAPYEGTWLIRAGGKDFVKNFPAAGPRAAHIYLVDPLGNVMLRYPRDPDPSRMIKDLQRLLKVSRIG
jgi:cytochrome oxidase Cu insertion factor (SCO1/SenC/PrrC family)